METTKGNWRTTLMGILLLLATGWGAYKNPKTLVDPQNQAVLFGSVATGIGLIAAKDAKKDPAAPPDSTDAPK